MNIRKYTASDLNQVLRLFKDTVHAVNREHYSAEQLASWAPDMPDIGRWQKRLEESLTYVADEDGVILGFCSGTAGGYIDMLFISRNHQRQGIGKKLITHLEKELLNIGITELYTEASITAKPFFTSLGYRCEKKQHKEHRGVIFTNYLMRKSL